MFRDIKDIQSPNRFRREGKMQNLKETMLNTEKFLPSISGLFALEKTDKYICAFTIVKRGHHENNYNKTIVYGDFYTNKYKMDLFNAELAATEERNELGMDSPIPEMRFSRDEALECTIINTENLSETEKALVEMNYEIVRIALNQLRQIPDGKSE